MSSSNPSPRGTTTQQRDSYELAVARRAAHEIRSNGERRDFAIREAFSFVDPYEHYQPISAEVVANAEPSAAELGRVEHHVHTLLTLRRPMPAADQIPLARRMPNGATVADWLGTAAIAAGVAKLLLERARNGVTTMPRQTFADAETQLTQALEELRAGRAEVTR